MLKFMFGSKIILSDGSCTNAARGSVCPWQWGGNIQPHFQAERGPFCPIILLAALDVRGRKDTVTRPVGILGNWLLTVTDAACVPQSPANGIPEQSGDLTGLYAHMSVSGFHPVKGRAR